MFACLPFMSATQSNILAFWSAKKERKITRRGRRNAVANFSPPSNPTSVSHLNILSDSEWRTQELFHSSTMKTICLFGFHSQSTVPNTGALISQPNLEMLSSNLRYPRWDALFRETSAEHGSLLSCLLHVTGSKLFLCVYCCLKSIDRFQYAHTHTQLYPNHHS